MDVTLAGKVSAVRPVQPEKAFLPMDTLPVSQKERLVRAVQFWKAPSSMLVAPAIGAAVIRGSDSTYVDLGVVKTVPTPGIFLAAAVVLVLIIPFVAALKKRGEKEENAK